MIALGISIFSIFSVLALIHFNWVLGNSWGFEDAIPKKEEGQRVLHPKKRDSLIVGIGLLLFGIFYLIKVGIISFELPSFAVNILNWLIPSIFLLRSIGDFKYIGFLKKIKTTSFATKDTKFYSPLCLAIAIIGFILGIS